MSDNAWVPEERHQTLPQAILALLRKDRMSAADLSKQLHQSEHDIYGHLQALKEAGKIRMLPPSCGQCGFIFEDRKRSKKPGKCPQCKATRIKPPLFVVSDKY